MKNKIPSPALLLLGLALVAVLGAAVAFAENVDPDDNGHQYAWGENVGWINAEPGGDGGYGMQVFDTNLSGYLWGENIGWISLCCGNTNSCVTGVDYCVDNYPAGTGNLRGYAWGENVGWISFSCQNTASCGTVNYGVHIDPATGVFSGYAWGENIGWINFSVPADYRIETEWRGAAPPAAVGGIAELPDVAPHGAQPVGAPPGEGSGWSAGGYAALASGLAATAFAVVAGAWYVRRRWVR
jgi:hypothetical protein